MKSAEALEDSTDEIRRSRFEKWLTEEFGSKAVRGT